MSPFPSRTLRLLAVLTAGGAVLFGAGVAGRELVPGWVAWVLILTPHGLSVVVCARTAVAAGLSPDARRFWRTASLALVVMAVGLSLRLGDLVGTSRIVHSAGALMMLWGLSRLPMAHRSRRARLSLWLDLAITLAAAAIFVWHLALFRHLVDPAAVITTIAMVCVGLTVAFPASGAVPPAGQRRLSLLPYAAVAAVDALLLHAVATDESDRMAIAVFAVLLTGLVVYRQVSAFRENELLKDRFRLIAQNSSDIVTITDRDHHVRYLSPATLAVLGHRPEDLIGAELRTFLHPDDLPAAQAAAVAVFTDPSRTATYQARFRRADGSWRWLEVVLSNLLDQPSVAGVIGNARDITETRETQQQLSHDATHDALTGLANRVLFGRHVEDETRRPGSRFSVVLIDLDEFKQVNDTLGHAAGDALLVAVAERMRASVRPADLVARLGGDEFAILFENLGGQDVNRVLDRIADQLRLPVEVEDQLLAVRASFGVAAGTSGDDAGDLLRRADIAMYEAKARGEGSHQHYRPAMETRRARKA